MIQKNWRCVLQQNDDAFTKNLWCVYNKRIYSAIIRKIYGAFTKKSYGAFTKRTMLFWRKNLDATCPMETMFVRECFQTYGLGVYSYILRWQFCVAMSVAAFMVILWEDLVFGSLARPWPYHRTSRLAVLSTWWRQVLLQQLWERWLPNPFT